MKHLLLALSALLVLGTVACSKKDKSSNTTNPNNQCYTQAGYGNGYGSGYGNTGYTNGYNQNPNCVNGGSNGGLNAVCQRLWTNYPQQYQPQYQGNFQAFMADCIVYCSSTPQACANY